MLWREKRVLVTGGTRGIGRALGEALARAGARVVVTGRTAASVANVRARHPELLALVANLEQRTERAALAERVLAEGPLDVLVNNAGVQVLADFRRGELDEAALAAEIELNLGAVVHLTKLFLPALLARPEALVLNVSSGLALVPKRSAPVYCATKAGVRAFTRALRYQLAGTSVAVVELLPPLVDTDMTRGRGRAKATPQDIARETVRALGRGATEIRAGKTKLLFAIHRVSPSLAARLLRDS